MQIYTCMNNTVETNGIQLNNATQWRRKKQEQSEPVSYCEALGLSQKVTLTIPEQAPQGVEHFSQNKSITLYADCNFSNTLLSPNVDK